MIGAAVGAPAWRLMPLLCSNCGNIPRRAVHVLEKLVIECPYRGLGSVVRTDLSEDRLHMGLHGQLGNAEKSRNMLVGFPLHDALEDCELPR